MFLLFMNSRAPFIRRDAGVIPGDDAPLCEDDRGAERIDLLSDRAAQTIRRVIAQRFPPSRLGWLRESDREDLISTAMLRVLQRLHSESDPGGAAIEDLDRYVATVTLHACDDLTRERFPRRTAARNRIVYVLLHDARYAQWSVEGDTFCGLAPWRGRRGVATVSIETVRHLAGDRDVRRLLATLFDAARQPVALDVVINIAAELWGMIDLPPVALDDALEVTSASTATGIDDREFLARLWTEIRLLNAPQRAALLLNLRDDSGSATELFTLLGVATIGEIADAVGLPQETFATLWSELPIEDLRIAELLDLTRQQVINLRRAARDRLRRRMRY
ncbi:MAG TPA: hypothetical protein VJZ76_16410 [Thermoanaerobaculia bacterium]|nr:hypothetical protein [Thermoanaerobaculia bacterium]